jgi:hypothetical protein
MIISTLRLPPEAATLIFPTFLESKGDNNPTVSNRIYIEPLSSLILIPTRSSHYFTTNFTNTTNTKNLNFIPQSNELTTMRAFTIFSAIVLLGASAVLAKDKKHKHKHHDEDDYTYDLGPDDYLHSRTVLDVPLKLARSMYVFVSSSLSPKLPTPNSNFPITLLFLRGK